MPLYKLTKKTKPPVFPLSCAHSWGEDQYGLWITVDIAGVDQTFRWCPPGEFMMGSPEGECERLDEEKLHKVKLNRGFWLANTTCTQELWKAVMNYNPSIFTGTQNPVERVSFIDCNKFIDKLIELLNLFLYLPSEAEWEYACRAGTNTPFSFGENITPRQVNYNGHYPYNTVEKGEYRNTTISVKSLPCNDWGFFEMHGNVWEWCADKFQQDISCYTEDPLVEEGELQVIRGGCWLNDGGDVRSAFRDWYTTNARSFDLGFRFAIK